MYEVLCIRGETWLLTPSDGQTVNIRCSAVIPLSQKEMQNNLYNDPTKLCNEWLGVCCWAGTLLVHDMCVAHGVPCVVSFPL